MTKKFFKKTKPKMSEEITPLPFPLECVWPIGNVYDLHFKDDESGDVIEKTDCERFYFTIPMDKLRPSPCTFNDNACTRIGEANKLVLITLFHLMNVMFYGDKPRRKTLPNEDGKRVHVFMEYLLPEGIDVSDFTLIDAIGIRFHIHIYDDDLKILTGIQKLIEANGGASYSFDDAEDQDNGGNGPPRKKRKKAPPPKKKKIEYFYAYEKLKSMWAWFSVCNAASKKDIPEHVWADNTVEQENWTPGTDHPFHPNNFFSWENSLIDGMLASQRQYGDNFGVPAAVYYIAEYMRNPLAILGVTLPRTPLWFEQDRYSRRDTMSSLSNQEFMESRLLFDSGFIKRNDLKEIKTVQDERLKKLISRVSKQDNAEELIPKAKLDFRKRSVKYIAGAWRQGAFVSRPIQILATKAHESKTWTTGPIKIIDSEMSSFGNFMGQLLFDFENVLRISTTHTILLRVLINSLDAYRNQANLHNNVVLLGEGATGKSHILDCVKNMMVDGTVKSVTHVTDKAAAIDTDNNDHITCYHEMPPQLLGSADSKGGQETGSHIIKDMMTSCNVETNTIHVDDTGRRRSIKVTSECIGVFIMATNERFDKIPQALATRMIPIIVNDNQRTKFGINDMTCKIRGVTGGEYDNAESMVRFETIMRNVQNVMVMIEKMIYINILEDVGMAVFDTMQINMTQYMINNHIMYNLGNIREIKYLRHFARTLTIMHAAFKFISDPKSVGYDKEGLFEFGTPKSFKKLMEIQPYLFCTEEIALFTLTVNADQLIKVYHFKVVELLLHSAKNYWLKDGDDLRVQDGYIRTQSRFKEFNNVYNMLEKNQGDFTEKISRQNIIVAFKELQNKNFDYQPIIKYDMGSASIMLNYGYVKKHFTYDVDDDRFYCNFDLNNIMLEVFNKAYANTFTKPQKRMLIGTTFHKDAPFLFNTADKKPNMSHVLTRNLAVSINEDNNISDREENEFYERVNDKIKFKVDFEDFCYQSYLVDCGFSRGDFNVTDILYDHHVEVNHGNEYPKSYAEWMKTFTGINLK